MASPEIIINKSREMYILYSSSTDMLLNEDNKVMGTSLPLKKLFDPTFLKNQQLVNKVAQGRGETIFFNIDNTPLVLRHYHRGGLVAKVFKDHYLWVGLEQTRAYRELAMLMNLSTNNLPAPKPFAARIVRTGCFYRADIITHALIDTETFTERLQSNTIDDKVWQTIGETIAQFHQNGIYHADLNAHNILLNSNNDVFIIDFDKAKFKDASDNSWRQQNLQRLKRSLIKLSDNNVIPCFDKNNWTTLEQSYHKSG